MRLATTPRSTVLEEGTARLYRFEGRTAGIPLLLVPSMINRWYILDLRPGASLAAALVEAGIDTWCLDWGAPEDEDRYVTWERVLGRLARAVRTIRRRTGARSVGLLGYCMGGTLAGIQAALEPEATAAFVNLAGPFDFSKGGFLAEISDRRWFDAAAVAEAGNVHPMQMQSAFQMLRPTTQIAKWVGLADRFDDPAAREAFEALETWAGDNVGFPAAAYETYLGELYQDNRLVRGEHAVSGRRVDLGRIRCPVLTIVAEKDVICPPEAATALNDRCGSEDASVLRVPGGHVGAVVGGRAPAVLYPAVTRWLTERLLPEARRPTWDG